MYLTGRVKLPPWIAFISCDENLTTNISKGDPLINLVHTGVAAIVSQCIFLHIAVAYNAATGSVLTGACHMYS
jgi:hypothetical protein